MSEPVFFQQTHDLYQSAVRVVHIEQACFNFGWHFHDSVELAFIESGSGRLLLENASSAFAENSLLLLGTRTPHAFISKTQQQGHKAWIMQFDRTWLESLLKLPEFSGIKALFEQLQHAMHFRQSPVLAADFMRVQQVDGIERISQSLRLLATIADCSDYFLLKNNQSRRSLQSKTAAIYAYIDEHMNRRLTRKQIAEKFSVSESHLARQFKQATGYSLTDYIVRRRMQCAAQLLRSTSLPVAHIAERCGYLQDAFFSRSFRKLYGLSPRAYRQEP